MKTDILIIGAGPAGIFTALELLRKGVSGTLGRTLSELSFSTAQVQSGEEHALLMQLLNEKLSEAVKKVFDLRPSAIIRDLDLRKPQYKQLAAYGHIGREDLGVAWEKRDRVEALLEAVK